MPPFDLARFELEKSYNLDSDDGSDLCSNGSDEDENGENGKMPLRLMSTMNRGTGLNSVHTYF
jgi:hypothetical protein